MLGQTSTKGSVLPTESRRDPLGSTVVCKNGMKLALAELDGVPLCTGCLYDRIKKSRNSHLIERIRPLRICRNYWNE